MFSALKIIFTVLLMSELTTEVDTRDLMARSVSQGNETLLSKDIRKLQHQLFTSIQSRTKLLKMAIFQSECTTSGCDFHGIDVNSGLPCNKKIFRKLVAIEKSLEKTSEVRKQESCPKNWVRYKTGCFMFSHTKMNWFQGHILCRSHSANLVIMDSKDKNAWFVKEVKKRNLKDAWMDGNDLAQQGAYVWFSSGKHLVFSDFHKGQPDGGRERCLHVHSGFNYQWNNIPCENKYPVVCEKDIRKCN